MSVLKLEWMDSGEIKVLRYAFNQVELIPIKLKVLVFPSSVTAPSEFQSGHFQIARTLEVIQKLGR